MKREETESKTTEGMRPVRSQTHTVLPPPKPAIAMSSDKLLHVNSLGALPVGPASPSSIIKEGQLLMQVEIYNAFSIIRVYILH